MTFWSRLRTLFRGNAPRTRVRTPRARIGLEALEERLAFSTTAMPDLSYEEWREQRFTVDTVSVANQVTPTATIDPQTFAAPVGPTTQASGFENLIGLDRAFSTYNYRGQGYTVAVIDTGIDYRHPALGGGFGVRVVDGWDFVNNDSDPMDDNGHGTHVAGIIGSSSGTYPGVAPNVNLVALKVLGADGSGSFGYVESALRWVINNQAKYNIVAVNLSLGAGNYAANPYAFLDDEFSTLKTQGVFIAAAAGNSFYSYSSQQGLGYPSISPYTVSVGAVWDGNFGSVTWGSGAKDYTTAPDRITSFTQRSASLDIMAPGALITSTYLNNGYQSMAGTSMATPVVAGAAALIHQALDANGRGSQANQDTILSIMQSTGVTIGDGDDENDNVTNTGLAFKRLDVFASLQSIARVNYAPTLAAISDKVLTNGSNFVVTLNGSDANNDPLTYSARVVSGQSSEAAAVQQQLGLSSTGSYYTNTWGMQEKWLLGKSNDWYILLPNGQVRKWAGSVSSTQQSANLVATLDVKYYQDPALLINAQSTSVPVTLNVSGNQLTITPTGTVTSTFTVEVTVSDGAATAVRTFVVWPNNAPTLSPIANQTVSGGGRTANVTLSGQDSDGHTLSYSAQVAVASQQAVILQQTLGLRQASDYVNDAYNYHGMQEKWIYGNNAAYAIFPDGQLRQYFGVLNKDSMRLVATLDKSYWLDPSMLWNAPNRTTGVPAGLGISGNNLAITSPIGFVGSFVVRASVSDGHTSTVQYFSVSVGNTPPTLGQISNVTVTHDRTSAPITLSASDVDGNTLTYSAQVAVASQQAVNLQQTLGLRQASDYANDAYNYHGMQEKWIYGNNAAYAIFPDGQLRQFFGVLNKDSMQLVASLDKSYWLDPSLLWNAPNRTSPTPSGASFSFSGNNLTITPPAGYVGNFVVRASVSDGSASAVQYFVVTVTNAAPTLAPISNVSARTGETASASLSASDADGDALTYTYKVATASQQAVNLQQTLGLRRASDYVNDAYNYHGMQEKWIYGNNAAYAIFPDGQVRQYYGVLNKDSMKLVATLDASYWVDPSLLYNASNRTVAPVVTFTQSGNTLNVRANAGYVGSFVVKVTASDGLNATERCFIVTYTA